MHTPNETLIEIRQLRKGFVLHNQGGVALPVLGGVDLAVRAGECVVLAGPSGAGKSSLLRCLYGNYKADDGEVLVRHGGAMVDIARAHHRTVIDIRRRTLGYVSQFLRVVPRVTTLDVVAEPLLRLGVTAEIARERAASLLAHLAIPERLWRLAPQTFSGGEQQRVNIARGFAVEYPVFLLDEPTSALDGDNRARVAALIEAAKARGAAVVGIFHDQDFAAMVGTRRFPLEPAVRAAA
jgi:alpha-D-ribose 1-methylphosphonate 5-triphosphate synthase subunit PhnL